jgi:hypothetical protein
LETKPSDEVVDEPKEDVHAKPSVTEVDQYVAQRTRPKSADYEVILVYPFIGGEPIEDAAKGCS